MTDNLQLNYQYFVNNSAELLEKYYGKIVVIANEAVQAVAESDAEAVRYGATKFGYGNFIVQTILPQKQLEVHIYTPFIISG